MSLDDDSLERLLSGGHLSGAAYDRIEERVLARVTGEPRAESRRWWWALAAATCSLGALLFAWNASELWPAGFTAKGDPSAAVEGSVELACASGAGPCRAGETLMFLIDSGQVTGYLSASALRLDSPSAEPVWFFPTASGEAPYIAAGEGMVVASQGVRIGANLPPGRYLVAIRFTPDKPTRSQLSHADDGALKLRLTIEE
jgi:hypothetical protein